MATEDGTATEYAGFWRRFAAHTLDVAVMVLLAVLVGGALGLASVMLGVRLPEALSREQELAANLAGVAIGWLYFALQESGWRQATVGKRLMGVQVTDLADGRISFVRATARYFATFLSYLTLGIGFLMAAFTARRQTLHDMAAGTLVVRSGASATLGWTLFGIVMAAWLALTALALTMALPVLQAQHRLAGLPPAVRAAEAAADAVEAYAAEYRDLPLALEDAGWQPDTSEDAPLVSLDPETARIAIALRDGSSILVMTPVVDAGGRVRWTCEATPDTLASYPARCNAD